MSLKIFEIYRSILTLVDVKFITLVNIFRIELGVLSVVAQQIQTIQQAKASNIKEFQFEGSFC